MSSRISETMGGVPYVTLFLLLTNTVIHIYNFLFTVNVNEYAIQAHIVLEYNQWYRVITSAFIHGGFFHLLMNMMSLYQLGVHVEQQFGSMQFFFATSWCLILDGTLYCYLSWLLTYITGDNSWLYSSAVGYSGVLFSYAMVFAYHTSSPTQSLCGFVDVPSKLYPWIILILIQVVLPNISMIGHLSGVIIGFLLVSGVLSKLVLPSDEFYEKMEANDGCLSGITRSSSYVRCTGKSLLSPDIFGSTTSLNYGNRDCWSMAKGSCLCCVDVFGTLYTYIWYFVETITYICGQEWVTKRNFHSCLHGMYSSVCHQCGRCCSCIPAISEWCHRMGGDSSGHGNYSSVGANTTSNRGVFTHSGTVLGSTSVSSSHTTRNLAQSRLLNLDTSKSSGSNSDNNSPIPTVPLESMNPIHDDATEGQSRSPQAGDRITKSSDSKGNYSSLSNGHFGDDNV